MNAKPLKRQLIRIAYGLVVGVLMGLILAALLKSGAVPNTQLAAFGASVFFSSLTWWLCGRLDAVFFKAPSNTI